MLGPAWRQRSCRNSRQKKSFDFHCDPDQSEVKIHAAYTFLLQDNFCAWQVKRATWLFHLFRSNAAWRVTCFCCSCCRSLIIISFKGCRSSDCSIYQHLLLTSSDPVTAYSTNSYLVIVLRKVFFHGEKRSFLSLVVRLVLWFILFLSILYFTRRLLKDGWKSWETQ